MAHKKRKEGPQYKEKGVQEITETFLSEMLTVLLRIITIFPLLLVITLYMGKRSIGEMPVFDFLIIITLASVTGADIADPSVSHAHTAWALVIIGLFQRFVSRVSIRWRTLGKKITFEPTMVIANGKFLPENMKKIRYSIDNVLGMLREKGNFHIGQVKQAIIESNGQLSVLSANSAGEDKDKGDELSFPLILDGKIDQKTLKECGITADWLATVLRKKGIYRTEDVFFAAVDQQKKLYVTRQKEKEPETFPRH